MTEDEVREMPAEYLEMTSTRYRYDADGMLVSIRVEQLKVPIEYLKQRSDHEQQQSANARENRSGTTNV